MQENRSENVVCEMEAILTRRGWDDSSLQSWGHTVQLNLPSGLPFVFIYKGTVTDCRAYTIVEHSGILEKSVATLLYLILVAY